MRILMGIPFLHPAPAYGGAARAAYYLAESLQRLGNEVTVLTTDVWDSRSRYPQNGNGAQPSFEVIRVPNLSNLIAYHYQFYTPMGVLKHAQRLVSQTDVLHLHTFRNLLNDLLARTAIKQGVPYILTAHGTVPRIERFYRIKRMYDLLIGRWQLNHASACVALTRAERGHLRAFGLPAGKIRLIPNGVPNPGPIASGLFRARWGIAPDERMLLFLGKITQQKGLQYLVRAFARIRNEARLVIAGNETPYARHIRTLIDEFRLQGRIIWTGLLQDEQKYQALQDADLTVYPSYHEAFGLVPLESILCGTPVVVSGDDGCGEIIRSVGGGELVPWGDVSMLAFVIKRQLEAGKDLLELQEAQERIQVRFHWRLIARRTMQLYQGVLTAEKAESR